MGIMEKKCALEKNSVWTLACCEWRAAAPGLKPLRLPRAQMPVPYSPPNVGAYTRTPSHNHYDSCSAVGAQITSLRSDDLVMPKLPACGCE